MKVVLIVDQRHIIIYMLMILTANKIILGHKDHKKIFKKFQTQ